MPRRSVSQLSHKEVVDQVFLVGNKQLRPNRNGNLYLQMQLADRSGAVNAMMWNATDEIYRSFDNGQYIHVTGTAQLYQGEMQLIATKVQTVPSDQVNEEDFIRVTTSAVDKLTLRLGEILRGMTDIHLRNLADCFLLDEQFMQKFTRAPAAIKNHHAYRGGLLEHVVNMMEVGLRIAEFYPQLDRDLLLFGTFLHDMGKIDELGYGRDFSYTDEGQLIGHIVMAVGMLEAKIAEAEKLSGEAMPQETALRLKHMIVSHHGQYDFGSPKLPMTLEAVALHQIDNLDAKLHSFDQLMREDPNTDSTLTSYIPNLGRKLYKGSAPPPGSHTPN